MNGLVSIIIPCFKQGRFLGEALHSLKIQTYPNWEAIIVNDGSPDETSMVASSLCREDPRIRYIEQANKGVSAARNRGLEVIRGEFVQFLDADDRLDSCKLEAHTKVLRVQPEVSVVYGNARYFADGNFGTFSRGPYAKSASHDWIAACWEDRRPMLNKLIERNLFPICTPLLRRSVVDLAGPFNEELVGAEDWEYWIRCAVLGAKFQFETKAGTDAFIRMHSSSATQDAERMRFEDCLMRMICHHYCPPGQVRTANLKRLLRANSSLNVAGREERYLRILHACCSSRERVMVKTGMLIDRDGPFYGVAHQVDRLRGCLASPVRALIDMMGKLRGTGNDDADV